MARSSYIYIVFVPNSNLPVISAFTVKHELMTWLAKNVEMGILNDKTDWMVLRSHDGALSGGSAVPLGSAYKFWTGTVS